ncbi:MAG: glycogen/starch synthase, partial [Clostridia bacterium]|nr:glycogen/starch synthase [Clostridia bacterium]
ALEFYPDIIHCHDWQTALVLLALNEFYPHIPAKTVFTVHNLKYQGRFTHWFLHNILGLGDAYFTADRLEFYGQVNLLKGGILWCDALTTVSPTYAREIRAPWYGEGLDGLLRAQEYKLRGILNGLDYQEYDPARDKRLYACYRDEAEGKAVNKARLQEDLGLPVQPGIPLLGMVSRLTAQKGLDLLLHIVDELLRENVQLAIVGAGERHYEELLSRTAARYPEKFRLLLGFEEGLARKVYAASDIFLMPSQFEPCGLGQMIAMRYGAVPVVRATGGLGDTVRPFDDAGEAGNGFAFTDYNAHDFFFTLQKALKIYGQPRTWRRLVEAAIQADFSWDNSAREYQELYNGLLQ